MGSFINKKRSKIMWEDEESPMIEMQVTLLDKKVRVEDW